MVHELDQIANEIIKFWFSRLQKVFFYYQLIWIKRSFLLWNILIRSNADIKHVTTFRKIQIQQSLPYSLLNFLKGRILYVGHWHFFQNVNFFHFIYHMISSHYTVSVVTYVAEGFISELEKVNKSKKRTLWIKTKSIQKEY